MVLCWLEISSILLLFEGRTQDGLYGSLICGSIRCILINCCGKWIGCWWGGGRWLCCLCVSVGVCRLSFWWMRWGCCIWSWARLGSICIWEWGIFCCEFISTGTIFYRKMTFSVIICCGFWLDISIDNTLLILLFRVNLPSLPSPYNNLSFTNVLLALERVSLFWTSTMFSFFNLCSDWVCGSVTMLRYFFFLLLLTDWPPS